MPTTPVYLTTTFTAVRTTDQPEPADVDGLADLLAEVIDAHYPVDHEDTTVEETPTSVLVSIRYSALNLEVGDAQAQHATTRPRGWRVKATTRIVPDEG